MKKKKQVEITQNILSLIEAVLATIMNYLAFVAVFVVLSGTFGVQNIHVGSLCVFVVVPFVFYALRCKCRKIILFFSGHLLTVIICGTFLWLRNHTVIEWVLYSAMLLMYIGLSIYLKSETEDGVEDPLHPALMVGIFVVGFWLLNYVNIQNFQPFLLVLIVIYFGFYFAHHYLENYLSFVKVNKISAGKFQGKKLFRLGAALTGGYILFSTVLLFFFTNPALGKGFAKGIKNALLWLMRFVFSFFSGRESEQEPIVEETVEQNMVLMEEWGTAESGLLGRVLDMVLEFFLFLLFAAAIITLAAWIVRKIQEMFRGRKRKVVIEGESSIQDITEQLEKEDNRQKKQSIFYGLSINARIRKLYVNFMLEHQKQVEETLKQSISCSTARESASVFEKENIGAEKFKRNKMADIVEVYEKARYSLEECTVSEIRAMKKGLSKVRE